jgi:hypothetical protein
MFAKKTRKAGISSWFTFASKEILVETVNYGIKQRHRFLYTPSDAKTPQIAYDLCKTWMGKNFQAAENSQFNAQEPMYTIEIECLNFEYLLKNPKRVITSMLMKWFDLIKIIHHCTHPLSLSKIK